MMGRKMLIRPKSKVNTSQSKENPPSFPLSLVSVHPELRSQRIEIRRRLHLLRAAAFLYRGPQAWPVSEERIISLNFPGLEAEPHSRGAAGCLFDGMRL
jgi:hypothetical protein